MKMKKIILFAFFLIFSVACSSQTTDGLIIKKDSLCYFIEDTEEINNLLYTITNDSRDTFYLWINKDDINLSEEKKVKNYFRKNTGNMSLYEMAVETNIIYGCPSLFNTFLKKIKPQEKFTIQIMSIGKISEIEKDQIFQYLDERLVIVKEIILEKYIKGFSNFNPQIFYKYDFITLPVSLIK